MNLVREIKQYQATDGTCFDTRAEAEQYEEMLQNPHFKKLQEQIEKLKAENKDLSDKIGKLKTELDRTRKALDKAKKGLKELKDIIACPPDISYETGVSMYADGVLQEITALEQKE